MTTFANAVDEIRARVDIIEIISEHVALKKSGRNWSGLCPFHPEKTPSFMVNRDKSIFKCFGCGAGGDALTFAQRISNKSFAEVIADLANKYGIQIDYSNQNIEINNQILELNKLATKYFTENLFNSEIGLNAKTYLNNRGINDDIIFQFNLGYAPNSWNNLHNHLSGKINVSNDLMEKAGLIVKRAQSEGYYDRFRDRVMIPIHNARGQVIAFGGRALSDDNIPKYLNSPETPVFTKGKNIYGLYQGKESIRKEDSVILVEGYFDAITAHASGITNVVATLGTALTSDQMRLLGKYTESKRIFIAFDADLAGGSATSRGIEVIKNTFGGLGGIKVLDNKYSQNSVYEVRVISIPDGKDPDDFIRNKGAEIFKRLIKNAPLLLDYQINQVLKANDLNSINGKVSATRELASILSEVSSPLIRSEYIRIIADKLSVREDDLVSELNQLKPGKSQNNQPKEGTVRKSIKRNDPDTFIITAERNLISLFFLREEIWDLVAKNLKEVSFSDNNHEIIISSIIEQIETTRSIDELTQKLLINVAENNEAMEAVSDILFSLEDKYCLNSENSIRQFIRENLDCISRFKKKNIEQGIKQKYYDLKDDEIKSLELQYEVRKIVNTK
ncbi:MAG: DNA primase [Cyanobacteriota bacterium]